MWSYRRHEGNAARAAELDGLPEAAVAVECDFVRADAGRLTCRPGCTLCRRYGPPVPFAVAMTILDDMAVFHARTDGWTCDQWNRYGLRCLHGYWRCKEAA